MTKKKPLYASITLPIPINTPYIYAVPDELIPTAEFGRRALVPFGKRMLTGFITAIRDNPGNVPPSKLKYVAEIIDDEPVFDCHMLKLAEWIADYYLSSVGEALKAAMPSGTMIKSRVRVHFVKSAEDAGVRLTERQKEVMTTVRERGNILLRKLERSFEFPVSNTVRSLEKKGVLRLEREISLPSVRTKTVRHVRPAVNLRGAIPARAREQVRCVKALENFQDGIALDEFLERYSFSRGVVNAVVKAGCACYEEVEVARISKILDQESIDADHPLTVEQRRCFKMVMDECVSPKPRPVLVKGVTGSGKTRLYIEIVREMLKKGKGAIILVPEISLTPQTTRFFTSVFPDKVAVLHSAMSPGERFDMWHLIHNGTCDVIIGPRSAVFAPLSSPGVIIVDEEHDSSYKQTDTSPRYNARDVAIVRGNLLGIPVVLGSATPSIESWHNASLDKYALSVLSKRVRALSMPEIRMVDMRNERAEGNMSSLSRLLRDELAAKIERGEKSIILINRRGFATGILCRDCGEVMLCPDCAVALTYHSSKGLALCHVCGHEQLVLEHCPNCGSSDISYRGMGTQRIEKELAAIVNPDSIIRMDSDTTSAHDAHYRLLEEFRRGAASILLGTQMVAKGLDFPEVTLVGIISADSSMYIPDFRAGERTFQLITQVAGRAGRGNVPGTVVLQTYNPENYAISAAMKQNFDSFAEKELKSRKEVGFPPFSRLVLIELVSSDITHIMKTAGDLTGYLSKYAPEETEVLGPVDAPISRVRGRRRIHILLKSQKITRLLPLVRYAVEKFHEGRESVIVDVDPINLM